MTPADGPGGALARALAARDQFEAEQRKLARRVATTPEEAAELRDRLAELAAVAEAEHDVDATDLLSWEEADQWDDDEHPTCTWCGGDGMTDCDDPLACLEPHTAGGLCRCRACDGRGFDQTIW